MNLFEPVGGWSFFYFILDVFVTLLIVRFVIAWTEKKNWKRFRQNYAKNLLERTQALARSYETGLTNFEPIRSENTKKKLKAGRTHYQLATGTALRSFGADAYLQRNEIRQSMELGFFAISADLSETVSNYKNLLDNMVDMTSLLIKADDEADLPPLTKHESERLRELKEYLFSPERTLNKMTGLFENPKSPFCKLRLHLLNFSFSVDYAYPKRRGSRARNFVRRTRRRIFPFFIGNMQFKKQEEILLGDLHVKYQRDSLQSFARFSEQCSEVDDTFQKVLSHSDIVMKKRQ